MVELVDGLELKREGDDTSHTLSLIARIDWGVKRCDGRLHMPCRELKPSTPKSLLAREGAEVSHQHRQNQNRCRTEVPA